MSELSIVESVRQDYEEYINKQAKVIQWYEKENRHNQEIIIKQAKEIERLNNIINELEIWLEEVDIFQRDIENISSDHITVYNVILDKLKELKENK